MAANERMIRAVLQYDVDNASVQKTAASTKQVEALLGRVKGETAATTLTAQRLQAEIQAINRSRQIDAVARDFAQAAVQGRGLEAETARVVERLRALGASEAEIRRVARAYDTAEKEAREFAQASAQAASAPVTASAASGGRQIGALGRAGTALRNLPSMQIPGAGVLTTDAVGNVLRVSDMLVASIAGLGPVGIAAAAGVTALTVVTGLYLNEINKVAEAERERLNIQTSVIEEARRQTREQLQASIAETQRDLNIANDRTQQLGRSAREAFDALSPVEQALVRMGGIGTAVSPAAVRFAELNDELTDNQKKAKELAERYNEQNAALADNLTAQNDTAEATRRAAEEEKRLADARRQTVLATADEARQNALENARFAGMSSNQLNAERQRLESDSRATQQAMQSILDSVGVNIDDVRTALDRMGAGGEKADDAIRKILQGQGVDSGVVDAFIAYRDQLRQNQDDINRLSNTYIPLATRTEASADANEKAAQSLQDMVSAANKVSEQAARNREAVADFQALQARAATAIAQAEQRVTDAIANGEQQRLNVIQKSLDQAARVAEDYGIDRKRAEEDLARELKRIGVDITDAQANRDALAALQANRRQDEAKEEAGVEARRRREDYQRRIRELAQATASELRILEQRTRDSVSAARAALEVERQKWNGEISLRQQALNEMLRQYNIYLSALRAAQLDAGRIVIQPNTVQLPAVNSQQAAYDQYAAYQRSQGVPGFAHGLERVPRDNFLLRAHRDEAILNRQEADQWRRFRSSDMRRMMGGSMTFAPTIYGTNRAQIKRQVAEQLDGYLTAAGL